MTLFVFSDGEIIKTTEPVSRRFICAFVFKITHGVKLKRSQQNLCYRRFKVLERRADVPDVITGLYDYPATDKHPAFTLQMRVNFVDGGGGGERLRLVGSDGVITISWTDVKVTLNKTPKSPDTVAGILSIHLQ